MPECDCCICKNNHNKDRQNHSYLKYPDYDDSYYEIDTSKDLSIPDLNLAIDNNKSWNIK